MKFMVDIKESYMQYKLKIDELFAAADNVFKKYSAEKYDAASGVAFNDFMKNEPKFNVETGELISPWFLFFFNFKSIAFFIVSYIVYGAYTSLFTT